MKMLKVKIEYGDMVIPREGQPFVDAESTQVLEIGCNSLATIDGEDLGKRIAGAMGELAREVEA